MEEFLTVRDYGGNIIGVNPAAIETLETGVNDDLIVSLVSGRVIRTTKANFTFMRAATQALGESRAPSGS